MFSKRSPVLVALLTLALYSHFGHSQGSAEADVSLTPAGDFVAKNVGVKGHATQKGDMIEASNIVVDLRKIETGLALRDKHARDKYLDVKKYPEMVLVKAVGKGGKGKGRIKYRGVEKDVEGTYKVEGGFVHAEFPILLSEFNVTGIKYMGVGVDDEVKIRAKIPLK